MAVTLNASASSGFVTTADTSTILQLQTNGTTAVTVDASANVGIGTASPAAKLDVNGNIAITASGGRITGDFSNATVANRVMFQSSTTNGFTVIGAIPNGTSNISGFLAHAGTDTANTSVGSLIARLDTSEVRVTSGITGTGTYLPMTFYTGGSERMRVDTSGNVGIGVTPATWDSTYKVLQTNTYFSAFGSTTAGAVQSFVSSNAYYSGGSWKGGLTGSVASLYQQLGGQHQWLTSGSTVTANTNFSFTQAMTLDASGNLLVGTTSSTDSSGKGVKIRNDSLAGVVTCTADSSTGVSNYHYYNVNATNNGYRFYVNINGGIANFSANNTNLSDERTKTNIQNAGSYLAKICAIPVRTFKYKDQDDDLLSLGVVAQEVEAVAPELVDVSGFGETPEDGIPLKAIYQTDLQYALMKCIQEQQALIQTLTDRITALEGVK